MIDKAAQGALRWISNVQEVERRGAAAKIFPDDALKGLVRSIAEFEARMLQQEGGSSHVF
jgi:hypothetical protein